MACHDYTNKVHYQMPSMESCPRPSPTPATLVTSTTSVTSNKSRRHVVYSSRPKYGGRYGSSSSSVSGGNKIRSHGGGRKSKSSIEDPDYLAHGTGIPRLVSRKISEKDFGKLRTHSVVVWWIFPQRFFQKSFANFSSNQRYSKFTNKTTFLKWKLWIFAWNCLALV